MYVVKYYGGVVGIVDDCLSVVGIYVCVVGCVIGMYNYEYFVFGKYIDFG